MNVPPGPKLPLPNTLGNTCGGTGNNDPGPGPVRATYSPGQQITVTWDITIPHESAPGVRIALQYSGTDGFANNVLVNNVDAGPQGQNSAIVTLPPGKTCSNCVLQWMWESTSDGGYYIGCSDVSIGAGPGPTPSPPQGGSFCADGDRFCMAFEASEDAVSFSLSADVGGYVAVGLPESAGRMAPSDVYIGWVDGSGNPHVSVRKATSQTSPDTVASPEISAISGAIANGKMTVGFTRPLAPRDGREIKDEMTDIIWSFYDGPAPTDPAGVLPRHTARGDGSVNFLTGETAEGSKKIENLKKAHGFFMGLAWLVLMPLSILVARYGKKRVTDLGVDWFYVHVGLVIVALFCTFLAFWLAVGAVSSGSHFAGGNGAAGAHRVMGLLVILAMMAQPVLGVVSHLRFDPSRKEAPLFPDKIHWFYGYGLQGFILLQILLGLGAMGSGAFSWIVVFAIIIAMAVLVVFMELTQGGQTHHTGGGEPTGDAYSEYQPPARVGAPTTDLQEELYAP